EERLTYRALDEEARRLAHRLIRAGVEPGDRVALHLLNGIALAVGYFGCFYAGAIAVPINTRFKTAEIAYVLGHSDASLYLGQPELLSEVASIGSDQHRVRAFVFDVRGFAAESETPPRHTLPDVAADEPAAIFYTSGTTARPKGVTHSHRTALNVARAVGHRSGDVTAIATPMVHMAGFSMLLGSLDVAGTAVMSARLDADRLLDDIATHRCTDMMTMPVMCQQLCEAQQARPRDVSSLRHCLAGGDGVSPTLKTTFAQAFGCPLHEIYGSTELGIIAANWSQTARLSSSCGAAMPDVEIAIADPIKDARGARGECLVRSPGLMIGYWNAPEATAAALKDGWFHTGDLVRQGPDGYLWFEGRRKEIIVHGGSNISPQEVEAVLYEHPGVREAGVVGAPDLIWGERVVAFVSRSPGSCVDAAELIAFVGERLAAYKTPERVVFLEALPQSAVGKIERRALREMLASPAVGTPPARTPAHAVAGPARQ
ncbi:MAG TPA: AMP-binding protein, partial [Caulobacteraceae bacterium]|nr:AMP-binding protein [Caulobacteraceae bacterium]